MPPYQSISNINEYHSVFADSLVAIVNKLHIDEAQARKIMVFLTRHAYILYRMDNINQRASLDRKLEDEIVKASNGTSRIRMQNKECVLNYDHILMKELEDMELERIPINELETKMFTYMTLAGIKPVQNTQQRAPAYSRFVSSRG